MTHVNFTASGVALTDPKWPASGKRSRIPGSVPLGTMV